MAMGRHGKEDLGLIRSMIPGKVHCVWMAYVPGGAFTLPCHSVSTSKYILHVNISTMRQGPQGNAVFSILDIRGILCIKYKLSKDQAASIKNAIKFIESMYIPES